MVNVLGYPAFLHDALGRVVKIFLGEVEGNKIPTDHCRRIRTEFERRECPYTSPPIPC